MGVTLKSILPGVIGCLIAGVATLCIGWFYLRPMVETYGRESSDLGTIFAVLTLGAVILGGALCLVAVYFIFAPARQDDEHHDEPEEMSLDRQKAQAWRKASEEKLIKQMSGIIEHGEGETCHTSSAASPASSRAALAAWSWPSRGRRARVTGAPAARASRSARIWKA